MSKAFNVSFDNSNFHKLSLLSKDSSLDLSYKNLITSKSISDLIYSDTLKSYFIHSDGTLDVSYYNVITSFVSITDNKKEVKHITVGNESDLAKAILKLEDESYYKYYIKSTFSKGKDLDMLLSDMVSKNRAKNYVNLHTLDNYKKYDLGKDLVFVDNKREYTSYVYNKSLDIFVSIFNNTGKKDKTFKDIYDYVYNSIEYNANGSDFMLITNLGNGEMACNGISRLVNELLLSNGYESELIGGSSHYWNYVIIDGKETTVDLTTDILTKTYGATLGESSKNHNKIIMDAGINFYSADLKSGHDYYLSENLEAKKLLD